jgi:hypothetical protein
MNIHLTGRMRLPPTALSARIVIAGALAMIATPATAVTGSHHVNRLTQLSRSGIRVSGGILARTRQGPRADYYLAVALPAARAVIGFARLGLAGVRAAKLADEWAAAQAAAAMYEPYANP